MDWDFSNEEAPERLTETECQPYGVNYGGGGLSMIRTSWNIYNLLDAQIEKSRAYQAQNQSYDIIVQLPQVDIQEKIRGMRDEAKRMEGLGLCTCDLDKFEPERNTWHTLECKCHKIAVEKSSRGEL